MHVTFVRMGTRECRTVVRLNDGRSYAVPTFGPNHPLPHDLGHFVVERALGVQTGFWGLVARGAEFPGMQLQEGRRPFHAEARARAMLRSSQEVRTEAEALAGRVGRIVAGNLDQDPRTLEKLFAASWWPRLRAEKIPVSEVGAACAAYREGAADWQALASGESMTLFWSYRRGEHAPEIPRVEPTARRSAPFVRRAAAR
jgi:hypothetical protein